VAEAVADVEAGELVVEAFDEEVGVSEVEVVGLRDVVGLDFDVVVGEEDSVVEEESEVVVAGALEGSAEESPVGVLELSVDAGSALSVGDGKLPVSVG
jgi:hypothetical protein